MWYDVTNGDLTRPAAIDETSSKVYVYVRRNIELVEATDEMPAHYRWQELKIPREMWEVTKKVFNHDSALDDVYSALVELAEIIVEG